MQLFSNDKSPLQGHYVEINKILHSKNCLLVLDDFGCKTGSVQEWEKFTSCLSSWGSGSKILITTHSPETAKQINVQDRNIHELAELEEDPFFELFMHHALDNDSNMREDNLEEVGRKIALKLKGDPKTAEVVGAQLRKKRSRIEWQKLSEKDWSEDEIMDLRIWSYQNLDADLQRCFAFCSLFPKGFRFRGETLIHLWMAEGFIKEENNGRMEDVGESYLHELVSNYFMEKRVEEGNICYVLHDLFHDLAERVVVMIALE